VLVFLLESLCIAVRIQHYRMTLNTSIRLHVYHQILLNNLSISGVHLKCQYPSHFLWTAIVESFHPSTPVVHLFRFIFLHLWISQAEIQRNLVESPWSISLIYILATMAEKELSHSVEHFDARNIKLFPE